MNNCSYPYWNTARYNVAANLYYYLIGKPTRLHLAIPIIKKGKFPMANFELPNDWVLDIPIQVTNSTGIVEPLPPGDVFTVVSSNPAALNAVVSTDASGNPIVQVNALIPVGTNYSVTLSDTAGLTVDVQLFDIIVDQTATNTFLDMAGATHTTQAVPVFTPPPPPPPPPSVTP